MSSGSQTGPWELRKVRSLILYIMIQWIVLLLVWTVSFVWLLHTAVISSHLTFPFMLEAIRYTVHKISELYLLWKRWLRILRKAPSKSIGSWLPSIVEKWYFPRSRLASNVTRLSTS
jgi:hypothetical protein